MSEEIALSQILERLFIGGIKDVKGFQGIAINILDYCPSQLGTPLKKEKLEQAVTKIRDELWSGKRVLVFCSLGTEFAPTAVMYFLMKMGMSKNEAIAFIKAKRPQAKPHPKWLP